MIPNSFLTVLLLWPLAAQAADVPLTLDEAIARGVIEAPRIAAQVASLEASQSLVTSAGRLPDPQLILGRRIRTARMRRRAEPPLASTRWRVSPKDRAQSAVSDAVPEPVNDGGAVPTLAVHGHERLVAAPRQETDGRVHTCSRFGSNHG